MAEVTICDACQSTISTDRINPSKPSFVLEPTTGGISIPGFTQSPADLCSPKCVLDFVSSTYKESLPSPTVTRTSSFGELDDAQQLLLDHILLILDTMEVGAGVVSVNQSDPGDTQVAVYWQELVDLKSIIRQFVTSVTAIQPDPTDPTDPTPEPSP
jgi:hypothetical protein